MDETNVTAKRPDGVKALSASNSIMVRNTVVEERRKVSDSYSPSRVVVVRSIEPSKNPTTGSGVRAEVKKVDG